MNKAILLIALLIAVAFAEKYELDLNEVSQYEAYKNTSIKLNIGDVLRLIVNENPTTGYKWKFQTPTERNVANIVYSVNVDEYVEDKVHSNDGQ